MPKIKCTREFIHSYDSELALTLGYTFVNPIPIDDDCYLMDLHGSNLEQYSSEDFVIMTVTKSKNGYSVKIDKV